MIIRYVSFVSNVSATVAAFAAAALGILLSTATLDAAPANAAQRTNAASQPSVASCVVVERPKHTIRTCRCEPAWVSNTSSIDIAEMIRLLIGHSSCEAPAPRPTDER